MSQENRNPDNQSLNSINDKKEDLQTSPLSFNKQVPKKRLNINLSAKKKSSIHEDTKAVDVEGVRTIKEHLNKSKDEELNGFDMDFLLNSTQNLIEREDDTSHIEKPKTAKPNLKQPKVNQQSEPPKPKKIKVPTNHETFMVHQGMKTQKQKDELKRKQEEYLKKYKPENFKDWLKLKLPLIGVIGSAVLIAFIGVNIVFWYFNGESTSDVLQDIQDSEMVGVVVKPDKPTKETKHPFIGLDFTDLKKHNADTVAWLKVGAVDIDIPIVQTDDNEYYLDHDINKKDSAMGWVFADARANMEYLGQNTVLYGHNLTSQQMFGNLKDIFNIDPEQKKKAEVVQLTTESQSLVFEIVSVYVTEYTDWKYVQSQFATLESKQKFIKRTQSKNEMAVFHRDNLSVNDQFLTFSTCYGPAGTKDRLVVVARLVAEKPNTDNINALKKAEKKAHEDKEAKESKK